MKNNVEIHGNLAIIHAKLKEKSHVVFLDKDDYERIKSNIQSASIMEKGNTKYCIIKTTDKKRLLLHRFILGITDPKIEVDHFNHQGLDCRRKNLRECTHAQNCQNQIKTTNVYYSNTYGKYRAEIQVDGKTITGSYLSDPVLARQEAVELRREYMPFSQEAAKGARKI